MNPIELQDVRKDFADRAVLRGVTMHLEPGELVGFVGPNGAGKTTCLRILLGLLPHDSGRARVLGMDPATDGLRIREHCCYLPGETSVYEGMRGMEFLRFALGFYPRHQADIRLDLIEGFALPLQKRVRTYSAGMKQKLALMATLIPDVSLYVLDEPDRALDATTRFFLREMFDKLHARGKTILLSSHHLGEVECQTDRLVFIMDGRILDDAHVARARRTLLRQIRLRLTDGAALPAGATEVSRDLDGTLHMAPDDDPLSWLARIRAPDLISAEVGVVHLEDLYRLLVTELPWAREPEQ